MKQIAYFWLKALAFLDYDGATFQDAIYSASTYSEVQSVGEEIFNVYRH